MNKVVVIGSINMDLIMKVDHIPHPGETVGEGVFYKMHGGKGANQAIASKRAGAEVTLISAVGSDAFGTEMISYYEQEGIKTDHIKTVKGPSGIALINIDENSGENSISVAPGANDKLLPADIEAILPTLKKADIIVLQNEVPHETVIKSILQARQAGVKVLYNPAPLRNIDKNHLSKVDILVVNEIEASTLCKTHITKNMDDEKLFEHLSSLDIKDVIVTLGSAGAVHYNGKRIESYNALEVEALDTTGAGDTFCGYLAAMISTGMYVSESIRYAIIASAIAVQTIGAQEAIPHINRVKNLISK